MSNIGETYSIEKNTGSTNTPVEEDMNIDENIYVTCQEEEVIENEGQNERT